VTDVTLFKKVEELSARVATLETENTKLQTENRLLRQKLDHYIRHYFGGQRNEGLDKHQLELLLQGLPNVIALPTPEPKPAAASRLGTPHPVRRMLAEDKLETPEIVIEPEEVKVQPDGWKQISEERTSQLDWVAPKIIKRVFIRPRYVKAECFAIAPLPPQPIEQGMVWPGFARLPLMRAIQGRRPIVWTSPATTPGAGCKAIMACGSWGCFAAWPTASLSSGAPSNAALSASPPQASRP
jgi:hypothetical protein